MVAPPSSATTPSSSGGDDIAAAAAASSATAGRRQTGTVTKWLNHRGIGFITPDGQVSKVGNDLLVHFSNIQQTMSDFKSLKENSRVEFETAPDPKNMTKIIAIKVTAIGGGDCEAKERFRGSNSSAGRKQGGGSSSSPNNYNHNKFCNRKTTSKAGTDHTGGVTAPSAAAAAATVVATTAGGD